jgi:hypothetical protein
MKRKIKKPEAICGTLVLFMFYHNSENKMRAEQVSGLACIGQR